MARLVAIGTGIALGAGFGPCAAGIGLSAGVDGVALVVTNGLAGGIATFIEQNFRAMAADPHQAAHYWQSNRTNFQTIITNSVISGAFAGATTYLLPGPSNLTTVDDWAALFLNRAGTQIATVIQTLFTNVTTGDPNRITREQILQQLRQDASRGAIIRAFN